MVVPKPEKNLLWLQEKTKTVLESKSTYLKNATH